MPSHVMPNTMQISLAAILTMSKCHRHQPSCSFVRAKVQRDCVVSSAPSAFSFAIAISITESMGKAVMVAMSCQVEPSRNCGCVGMLYFSQLVILLFSFFCLAIFHFQSPRCSQIQSIQDFCAGASGIDEMRSEAQAQEMLFLCPPIKIANLSQVKEVIEQQT